MINLLSFASQIWIFLKLRHREAPKTKSDSKNLSLDIFYLTMNNPILRNICISPGYIQVYFLGLMTFIPFILSQHGFSDSVVGTIMGAYSVGLLFGTLAYKKTDFANARFAFRFLPTGIGLLVGNIINIYALKYSLNYGILVFGILLTGIAISYFTILARSVRHRVVDSSAQTEVVAATGFLVKVFAPISGPLFGYIFSGGSEPAVVAILVGHPGIITIFAMGKIRTDFSKFILQAS